MIRSRLECPACCQPGEVIRTSLKLSQHPVEMPSMKTQVVSVLVLSLFLQGCVSKIGLAPETECAVDGYKLVSFTNSEMNGLSGGYGTAVTSYSGTGRSVQCAPLETEAEKERARHLSSSAEPIFQYNDKTLLRSAFVWAGAVFWIVPGLGVWYYYGVVKKDEALKESQTILRSPASQRIEPKPNL